MALSLKFGGLLKKTVSHSGQVPVTSMLNAVRCMSSQIYVGGLSWGTSDDALRQAFSGFGDVVDARVIMDLETRRSRGFGFVSFAGDDSAHSAISAMDGQELDGRTIRVNLANERPPRNNNFGGGEGYRSRGGGNQSYGGRDGGY